jgi:uroporphyrinogen-III synthase
MRLLLTRPEPDNARTAAALRSHGHHVLTAPMLYMEPLDCVFPDLPYSAVVMTSANAARAIADHNDRARLLPLPVYAVGRHTAEAARNVGFPNVQCAEGNRQDLTDMLRNVADGQLLLYLGAEDRAGDFDLASSDARVVVGVVYRMVKVATFPPPVESAIRDAQVEGVLHFSSRSAQAYIECSMRAGILANALYPLHFCLSRRVAESLLANELGAGVAGKVRIAARPDESALIARVNSYAEGSDDGNGKAPC